MTIFHSEDIMKSLIYQTDSVTKIKRKLKWMTRRVMRFSDMQTPDNNYRCIGIADDYYHPYSDMMAKFKYKHLQVNTPEIKRGGFTFNKKQLNPKYSKPSRYKPGDLCYCKEPWMFYEDETGQDYIKYKDGEVIPWPEIPIPEGFSSYRDVLYSYPGDPFDKWQTPLFMPEWCSRSIVRITGVKAERVQEISEDDAKAEGCEASKYCEMKDGSPCYTATFRDLWERIHGIDNPNAWESNPWVFAYTFEEVESCLT